MCKNNKHCGAAYDNRCVSLPCYGRRRTGCPGQPHIHAVMVRIRALAGGKSHVQPLADERNNSLQGHNGRELNSLDNQM